VLFGIAMLLTPFLVNREYYQELITDSLLSEIFVSYEFIVYPFSSDFA
jgi:hypothetical protein